MIGRFKYDNEIFYGEVKGDRVVVDKGLFSDTFLLRDLQLLPPVQPTKIICVGLNYRDHAKELAMEIRGFLSPQLLYYGYGLFKS